MSHLEQRMETDLNYIRDWVWNLGEEVEQALRNFQEGAHAARPHHGL